MFYQESETAVSLFLSLLGPSSWWEEIFQLPVTSLVPKETFNNKFCFIKSSRVLAVSYPLGLYQLSSWWEEIFFFFFLFFFINFIGILLSYKSNKREVTRSHETKARKRRFLVQMITICELLQESSLVVKYYKKINWLLVVFEES